jgi:hypothetical protein
MTFDEYLEFARRALFVTAWQLAASGCFLLLGGVLLGLPFWSLGILEAAQLGLMYVAYLASTSIPTAFAVIRRRTHPVIVIGLTGATFVLAWLATPLLEESLLSVKFHRLGQHLFGDLNWLILLTLAIPLAGFAVLLNGVLPAARWRMLVGLSGSGFLVLLLSLPETRSAWLYRGLEQPMRHVVSTSKYPLEILYFRERIPTPKARAGGFASLDGRLLLMTGDGLFYELGFSPNYGQLSVRQLNHRAPLNSGEFREQNADLSASQKSKFQAIDVLPVEFQRSGHKRLLVSHHHWKKDQDCLVTRVSASSMSWHDFLNGSETSEWQTIWESQPCLPVRVDGTPHFAGHQGGGRMIQTSPGEILLALGDFAFDGVTVDRALPQDMQADYGKVIEIDIVSGASRIVTAGHRSPGGLHRDSRGRIWLTEHGPKGGDELNRIRFGRNYGWPIRTLGSEYGKFTWPEEATGSPGEKAMDGDPADLEAPAFAFTPSIGISALVSIDGEEFSRWNGNIIVASLRSRSLFRIHLAGDTPVMAEAIPIYDRVRDVVLDGRGQIVFWTDRGAIGLIRAHRRD